MNKLHKNKRTVFDKKHKAADFTFYDGYIQIEGYVLESVKIKKIPSYLLNDINHEFTIVQEARRLDHFHFEPYTDLSILLNAVENASEQYADMVEKDKEEESEQKLAMQITSFILFYREKKDDKYKAAREEQFDFVSNVLIQASAVPANEKSNFDLSFDGEIFKVPVDDIDVFEGYINVNTKNIEFTQDVSWEGFCEYLTQRKQYHLIEKLGEDKSKEYLDSTKQAILQEKRNYKRIKIKTFLTKKSFTEVFINEWVENPIRTIHQFPIKHQPKDISFPFYYSNEEENDGRYVLSQIPVWKLRETLFSESFSFSPEVLEKYQDKVASLSTLLDKMPFWVTKDIINLRISKPYHEPYMNAILGFNNVITEQLYYILFQECYHHEYDDLSDSRKIKSHYSYLVLDKKNYKITLIPTCMNYSSYTFDIYLNADIMVSAYFIINYFSSYETNKRQRLVIDQIWRHFGIVGYHR